MHLGAFLKFTPNMINILFYIFGSPYLVRFIVQYFESRGKIIRGLFCHLNVLTSEDIRPWKNVFVKC